MPFNGSGTFTYTTAGFPVVPYTSLLDSGTAANTSDFILNIKRRW